jgi:hypothetical protein
LHTDPNDVGCEKVMELPNIYVDLAACGPCSEDFAELLARVVGSANLSPAVGSITERRCERWVTTHK